MQNDMISYKLAKQLKEAGFPQNGEWGYVEILEGGEVSNVHRYSKDDNRAEDFAMVSGDIVNTQDKCDAPTFSELIEACGEDFRYLIHEKRPSTTYTWFAIDGTLGVHQYDGSTPEEAVANLWLALNKK